MAFLDDLKDIGFRYATMSGPQHRHRRHAHPVVQGPAHRETRGGRSPRWSSSTRTASSPTASATTRWSTSGPTSPSRSPTTSSARWKTRARGRRVQPHLHDGGLRRAGLEAADPPARRHARPHGQAVGRDHRDPHHLELPRGPHRAGVLHLHPRRAQGSRRHRAQDRRLRLSDPAARRRLAGRHRVGVRLRHRQVHRCRAAVRGRRHHPVAP